ncbi:unnamed protein product [Vitrella brassicaformis CCMP3155]|uniref:FAD-binding FR-type domain-containing protein n=2 Tax=Vitrella brassicaformis TaxID=1169539 RepID=A0A0G4H505_VITBC|nr:unnamed protein product [Vitrella brassicaformis CCMP3155]|mmetsp:Transcript_9230/g.26615  ORF Transcript_9230/g.26615 Transcript_9230/m.26615 type:complete len:825 (+) Transcript_9230:155-2629(+)|eukprot:CEM38762.1 unnamed protein product [Vitrella brassicaformis CCMP3155]
MRINPSSSSSVSLLLCALLLCVSHVREVSCLRLRSKQRLESAPAAVNATTADAVGRPDVVVVGSGLAGLSAAIDAASGGAVVWLMEKERVGGNSAKATSGINGAGTNVQVRQGVSDSLAHFESDIVNAGDHKADMALVKTLVSYSSSAIDFLMSHNVPLNDVEQLGGHTTPRTHRIKADKGGKPMPIGLTIVTQLRSILTNDLSANVRIMTGARVTDILTQTVALLNDAPTSVPTQDVISGVRYTFDGVESEVRVSSVVLATGGYANDHGQGSLLSEFSPSSVGLPATSGTFATGDGIKMARSLGASLIDMDKVQVHPTGFLHPSSPTSPQKFLAPELLRGLGAMLLNPKTGERFVNELERRDVVTEAIFRTCPPFAPPPSLRNTTTSTTTSSNPKAAIMLMNEKIADDFGRASFDFYVSKGFIHDLGVGVDALAAFIGNGSGRQREGAKLRRVLEGHERAGVFDANDHFYVAFVTPCVHYTMGGLRISPSTSVLRSLPDTSTASGTSLQPIPGLFAAGEIVGGVHGANRLAGNGLLECLVFGRLAGRRAANTALIPPYEGALPFQHGSYAQLRLREVRDVNSNGLKIFRFDLPSERQSTGLSVGQYVAIDSEPHLGPPPSSNHSAEKPFSVLSRPLVFGALDILLKVNPDPRSFTHHLDHMSIGTHLGFRAAGGPSFHFMPHTTPPPHTDEWSGKLRWGLIGGGTGISPMLQIIDEVIFWGRTDIEVRLIYAAATESELVNRSDLDAITQRHSNIKVVYVLERPPDKWTGHVGFVTSDIVSSHLWSPSEDVQLVLAGPPPMCRALKPMLANMGYTRDTLYSYM